MSDIWLLALLAAVLTYGTRVAGHLVLSRFERIPPRVEAALDAVPSAMLITIVTPVFVDGGWLERLVIVAAGLLSLRLSVLASVTIGVVAMALLRHVGL
ncbi:AzlD family protein [uncultured Aureimonas sp.]|uniref:AzlD family protein n=1 Tax=uncultured Aureimonas sp. TaxID=1604662 RepID=UPI0025F8D276|nr:AzlD domain-containing protein [uncultured Aureimonas sp.]